MAIAFARLLSKRGNVIAGKVEKPLITLRLRPTRHVNTLTVLDYLPLKALLVGQLHDANGQLRQFLQKPRGTEAPCSCDDLVSVTVGANGDGLD